MCQIQGLEERLSRKLRTKELFNFTLDSEHHHQTAACAFRIRLPQTLACTCKRCVQVSRSPVAEDNGQQQVLQREPFICWPPPSLTHLLHTNTKKDVSDYLNVLPDRKKYIYILTNCKHNDNSGRNGTLKYAFCTWALKEICGNVKPEAFRAAT